MSATGVPRKKGRTTTVAEQAAQNTAQHPVHTRALIVGTGFSGLGMGVALQRQGVDFLILEKADDVGGTWRDNSYPGFACDVPSYLYSYSFEPKPDWTEMGVPVLGRSRRHENTTCCGPGGCRTPGVVSWHTSGPMKWVACERQIEAD